MNQLETEVVVVLVTRQHSFQELNANDLPDEKVSYMYRSPVRAAVNKNFLARQEGDPVWPYTQWK